MGHEVVRHRIGDEDREATVRRLCRASSDGRLTFEELEERVGAAYRARHGAELDVLVADLPEDPGQAAPADLRTAAPDDDADTVRWTVGVLGGQTRRGSWRPASTTRAVAVLGSCRLDVTDVALGPSTELRATAVLGGVEVVVPDGVHVEVSGFALLGTRDVRVRRSSAAHDAPRLRVRARAVCGGVTVRTPPRPVP